MSVSPCVTAQRLEELSERLELDDFEKNLLTYLSGFTVSPLGAHRCLVVWLSGCSLSVCLVAAHSEELHQPW